MQCQSVSDGGECLYLICTRAPIWGARRRLSPRNRPSRAAATPSPVQHCTLQFLPNNPQRIPFPMLHCKRHIGLPQCYTVLCTQNAAHCTLHHALHCTATHFIMLHCTLPKLRLRALCFAKCTQCTLQGNGEMSSWPPASVYEDQLQSAMHSIILSRMQLDQKAQHRHCHRGHFFFTEKHWWGFSILFLQPEQWKDAKDLILGSTPPKHLAH